MTRNRQDLQQAIGGIGELRERFWRTARMAGSGATLNSTLEKAGRVADFLEFAELTCLDALAREESCGCHFREEHQSDDGEALRDDSNFAHVAAWQYRGANNSPALCREQLVFETMQPTSRSYK